MTATGVDGAIAAAALRRWLDGRVRLPAAGTVVDDAALLARLAMVDAPGWSSLIDASGLPAGRRHRVDATLAGPRLWIDRDWNRDPPSLEGAALLAAIRDAYGLAAPDPAPPPVPPPVPPPAPPGARQLALL